MYDQFFGDNAAVFTIPALVGTAFFLLRMGMIVGGGDDGGDLDADVDAGVDSDSAFDVVSIQTVAAFLMGAGWAGLGAYRGSGLGFGLSLAIGVGGGVLMAWLVIWMMSTIHSLRTSGNIRIRETLGLDAEVYVEIPARREGRGQVQVVVNERLRTYNAVTEGEALSRGSTVRITKVNPDNSVTVARI